MRVGGYSLDLYCDLADIKPGEIKDALGHSHREFPHQYYGETGSECDRQARREGRVIGASRALCPKCNPAKRSGRVSLSGDEGTLPPDAPIPKPKDQTHV